ncbi:MAG: hypothetical protein CMJ78_00755 [Planctomycetaceae bacterium]|nr:hypothetical protein [Planctomycetaceae bacterium]
MKLHPLKCLPMLLLSLVLSLFTNSGLADDWFDTFYQYRIPFETNAKKDGWVRMSLSPKQITDAINRSSRFQFDSNFFAFNAVALAEVDDAGKVVNAHPEAGFYMTRVGSDLAKGWQEAAGDKFNLKVVKDKTHLLEFVSSDFGKNPAYKYETIFQPGSSMRTTDYRTSFFPPLLPRGKTRRKTLFVPDRDDMQLVVNGVWAPGKLHELSVREVSITLNAKLDKPGRKRWMLYYQPMCSHHLQTPSREKEVAPTESVAVEKLGVAQRNLGDTIYRLNGSDLLDVAYADTTVKVTRKMTLPSSRRDRVTVRSAANERQSFQLLLNAKSDDVTLTGAEFTDLKGKHVIPSSAVAVRRVEYVPIKKSSYITPGKLLGEIGDPLVRVAKRKLSSKSGTTALWVTVNVAPKTPAGTYSGDITLRLADSDPISIPVSLEVYGFELPEYSTFRSNLGLQYVSKLLSNRKDARNMLDYHGIGQEWPRDKPTMKKLARAYYDVMVDNKFTPKSVALYSEIDMNWTPPPEGYNVDKPGNFFEFHDWDFTEFNETLRHFIDEKKCNNICLTHTDPSTCNLFQELPGKRLSKPEYAPHHTMGWHTFRHITRVVWGKTKHDGYQDTSIEVTQKQWDDLVLKYYRKVAQNLEKHGWLDKTHILIDETENNERLMHFLKLLKSDPLTAKIRTAACIQGLGLIHKDSHVFGGKVWDFRGLLDIYVPEMDENYDRWMDYLWTDHEVKRSREKLWPYLVTSSRLAIDTPGINNRIVGLDIFNRGGSGLLIWETTGWDHLYGNSRNPWQDPYTRHANGSLAYFYPPKGDGLSSKPVFTIIPSLRMETYREAIDDYEYARILESLVADGRKVGVNVSEGEAVLKDIKRFFASNTHWSQNDAWYLDLRDRMARAIVSVNATLTP